MQFNIYAVCYSQCSHQHVSAVILAIGRLTLSLQEYKHTDWLTVSPSRHNNYSYNFG